MLKRRKQEGPGEINAGSMADIAFLLLIFFLVTTTMDTDVGILRLLPPILEEETETIVNQRDVYIVLVNDADQLLVEGQPMEITELRAGAKEFMTNPNNSPDLPAKIPVTASICRENIANYRSYVAGATDEKAKQGFQKALEKWEDKLEAVTLLGDYKELPGNAVMSLQTGSKTSYDMYVKVQNELEAAVTELRNELCKDKFGKRFSDLDEKKDDDKRIIRAIRMVYPQRVSEAEPVDLSKPKV